MANAVWLFLALPDWYFTALLSPFSAGILTAIPSAGALCLLIGVIWGVVARRTDLLWFLLLVLGSHLFVAIAGLMRGALKDGGSEPVVYAFYAVELAGAFYLIWRSAGARVPATFLAVFTISYAAFAGFIASMSFGDTWL
jgi:hypothetical protein